MKKTPVLKVIVLSVVVLGLLLAGIAVFAAPPVRNISARLHPNLAAAQKLVTLAYAKITKAQVANEFDMDGHAAKAKELLDQVNTELKLAAESANKNAKK